MMLCLLPHNIKAEEVGQYYISIESPQADQYVTDTIGEFINAESLSLGYNLQNVEVGKGIYIANEDEKKLLPSFYYPVYVNSNIEYVYRIYDDGTGNYQGIFSKNYAKEVKENASMTMENAGLWTANNSNEILVNRETSHVINTSKFGLEATDYSLADYTKTRSLNFVTTDITKNIEYTKRPQQRVYWDRHISYVENQTSYPWCAAYVTAAAIREIASNKGVRAQTIMSYFGKGSSDSCSPSMIQQYSSINGINFTMYNGVTTTSKILSVLEKWNLVYGGYSSSTGNHALLIHGIDGTSKTHVWNPWYLYSEWTSSVKTYKAQGTTYTMYRYGHFIER